MWQGTGKEKEADQWITFKSSDIDSRSNRHLLCDKDIDTFLYGWLNIWCWENELYGYNKL